MATAKEHIAEIIRRQPDDSSYDEIVRELAFDLMVQGVFPGALEIERYLL